MPELLVPFRAICNIYDSEKCDEVASRCVGRIFITAVN